MNIKGKVTEYNRMALLLLLLHSWLQLVCILDYENDDAVWNRRRRRRRRGGRRV